MYTIYTHALGHITNKLPLALEPISHVFNAHGIYIFFKFSLVKCFSERISNVLICGNPFYLHILSANDLVDQMVAPENVFRSLM